MEQIITAAKEKMRKAVDIIQQDLASIRSGRATPSLVENIVIHAYGGSQHLRVLEMATIHAGDPKTIVIAPYDPSIIEEIVKGIQEANVGLTPVVDGEIIRISIPALSEERRLEYVKLARTKIEAGRIMIRQIRQEAMRDLKRLEEDNALTEDERKHGEKAIQQLTDELIADIDGLGVKKEAELMQV